MGRLEGKTALITGAARGQGRSHAIAMAREGASIIALDVLLDVVTVPYPLATAEDLARTVKDVEAQDRRIVARQVDVRDLAGLKQIVDESVGELGGLDIVVANAGITSPAPSLEMSEETWQDMIDINLTGVWKTLKATVPHIIAGERGGSVVITSSVAAFNATPGVAHYSAAKGGLQALMRVLALELAPHRIRVNTVNPTTVATPMVLNDAVFRLFRPDVEHPGREHFEEAAVSVNKLPVPAIEAEDVTRAVLYLVSDDGRYVTGSAHMIDAGAAL